MTIVVIDYNVVIRGMGTQESSRLHGLDDRHCAISVLTTYENYDKILGTGVVTDRKIRQVPWCLTSYDSRGSKVVVDQECVRQSLAGDIYPMLSNSKHIPHGSMLDRAAVHQHDSGHLSQAGLETVPRSWWEILSLKPRECVVNHILPLLTKCSLIGSITLNTEGEYLLTAHPKYGFCIFSDIAFASVAAARKASCQSWQIWASRCDSMRVFFYCGFVVSAGMFIFSRPWWRHRDSSSPAPSSAYIPEPANDANYPNIQGRNDNVADENVENMNMCVICLSSARTVLVRPCRHLCLCRECYEDNYRIPSANNRVCPICRKDIASFDVIYNP